MTALDINTIVSDFAAAQRAYLAKARGQSPEGGR